MRVKPYIVRRGDTLSAIARFYDITLQELLDENPLVVNPNLIHVGQTILIPSEDRDTSVHNRIAEENIGIEYPIWMKIALREEGVTEVPGAGNNPRIIEYHATTSLDPADANKDSTAWCSSFVNWCMENAGINGTNSARARSWDEWGHQISVPQIGCVVVFSRKSNKTNDGGGHVGFYLSETNSKIEVLGGNQGNRVSRAYFPKNGKKGVCNYKFLSYRLV